MSSSNRGGQRDRDDYYPTPPWPVWRFLEAVCLPGGVWFEPSAGQGDILKAVNARREDAHWRVQELREECREVLEALSPDVTICNSLEHEAGPADVGIDNPPFLFAEAFAKMMMKVCVHTALLLRLNFLGGEERNVWLRASNPDVHVLPQRPSFGNKCARPKKKGGPCKGPLLPPLTEKCPECGWTARPQTDSCEYAWFHWWPGATGKLNLLPLTPLDERKIWLRGDGGLGTAQQGRLFA